MATQTMTNTRQELLQDLLNNPDDDFIRLAYADYLMDFGSERDQLQAEFIQLQIRINNRDNCYSLDSSKSFKMHESSIFEDNRRIIHLFREMCKHDINLQGKRTVVETLYNGAEYKRGFVELVKCKVFDWLKIGKWMVAYHPVIEVITTDSHPNCTVVRSIHGEVISREWQWHHKANMKGWTSYTDIPECVYPYLNNSYQSPQLAIAALGEACLLWAKDKES